MKTYVHLRAWYIAEIFSQWKMFQTAIVQKIKTHILRSTNSFFENRTVYETMWKNTVDRQDTDDNMAQKICFLLAR